MSSLNTTLNLSTVSDNIQVLLKNITNKQDVLAADRTGKLHIIAKGNWIGRIINWIQDISGNKLNNAVTATFNTVKISSELLKRRTYVEHAATSTATSADPLLAPEALGALHPTEWQGDKKIYLINFSKIAQITAKSPLFAKNAAIQKAAQELSVTFKALPGTASGTPSPLKQPKN